MLVCHCKRVSDLELRRAVREGASSPAHAARLCGAGTDCGGCAPLIRDIVRSELQAAALREPQRLIPAAAAR